MKCVIIGGGLTGLSLVHCLQKNNHEAILLESTEFLGGRFRGDGKDATELGFITPSEAAAQSLEWLKSVSPTPFEWHEEDLQPLQFESAEWRPFLGFGDYPSKVVDELGFLSSSKQWRLDPGFGTITRGLIEQLPIEARTLSEVTSIEVADGRVQSVTINGQEKITGDEFVFCPSPHLLNNLLPNEALKPASRSRLAKHPAWTSVGLTLFHGSLGAPEALRFVLGSGKEFEPVVGRVWPDHSVWLNLVGGDFEEDLEHVGNCVRFIKRTLKRVWPELVEGITSEKIRVRPQAFGRLDLKLKNGLSYPELPNLHIADARLGGIPGDLSAAAIAHQVARLFVAGPQPTVLSDSDTFHL